MIAFSRVLKRQAGATVGELAFLAAVFAFSLALMVGYGVYVTSAAFI
jgi:hypothetical protein